MVLVVLGLDGRVGQVVRVEVGQVAALEERRARHQLLLGQDGVDVVVRVLRHDQLCFAFGLKGGDCNDTPSKWHLAEANGGKKWRETARMPATKVRK